MSKTHIPAWKRLGLKLKYAKETTTDAVEANGTEQHPKKKRRVEAESSSSIEAPKAAKKSRTVNGDAASDHRKAKKQVSFTSDTKETDGDTAVSIIPSEQVEEVLQPKKKVKQAKPSTQPSETKSQGVLDYLTDYYRSNSTWKFNKNRETWILKNACDVEKIPVAYNVMLAQYINGIKSQNTRTRLRMQCIAEGAKVEGGAGNLGSEILDEGKPALETFPGSTVDGDSELSKAFTDAPRVKLILWALDPGNGGQTQAKSEQLPAGPVVPKKRKNRTTVVEYSSTSESSSSESSSSESDDSSSSNESSDA